MRILLVTSRYPWPPRRGDQIRAVQALDVLAGEHEVTLLAPEPGDGQPPPPAGAPFRVELYRPRPAAFLPGLARAVLHRQPLQSALFYQPDLGRRLRELAPRADLGILQLVRLAIHREDFGTAPILVDLIDSLALNLARRAAVDRAWLRPLLRLEARRLAAAERRLVAQAAGAIVVCDRDRQVLIEGLSPEVATRVSAVHLAVPERLEMAGGPPDGPNREEAPVLALTGNLGYFVNVDAATWWLTEVWPLLREAHPDVRVVVAGDRPARAVRRAVAGAGPRVQLLAAPPDLRAILARATLALAPLRCGSGVPVKILEAWAAGVPVVATPWAAAGTTGRPGEDLKIAGEQPREWVEAILSLLDDPEARERLRDNGRRRLAADYSRAVVRGQWLGAVEAGFAGTTTP